ncbi:hypothetical protein [Actinoplanes palleronii]|uniref:SHOCT domain-containing protein n=1 Tax=Actinoplanes palleronii TaxID=113570 RepID=A0ABQ4BDS6_9ACTN|nr:hypothetical protein [Actinoplanes palleronii]GIE68841.1 hypothetical protein Apa02nite_049490 [Actinoplanes palleronii]
MMILLVALIGVVVALGMAFWPWPGRGPEPRHAAGRVPPPVPAPLPASLEGVLAAQLLSGDITGRQYVRALERIAARDERRHPMSVPRDYRP